MTDIAVLVVAADDGVMPQTVEAIDHIKAAEVPIIVAINKMDSPNADPERVRRQLSEREFVVEKWGGDVIDVEVSAKAGDGIDDLLESIELVAEVSELRANPNRPGVGVVVEAELDRNRGVLGRILVQTGTLRVGDHIVVGSTRGRVKALVNAEGKRVHDAGPSMPVEVLGLSELPGAGDRLVVVADEKTARATVAERLRREDLHRTRGATLEEMGARISSGQTKELRLVLKTDVQGSVAAVRAGAGAAEHAGDADTPHPHRHGRGYRDGRPARRGVGRHHHRVQRPPGTRARSASRTRTTCRYGATTSSTASPRTWRKPLHGLLEPEIRDVTEGTAEVRAVFSLGRSRKSAGCYVTDGRLTRGARGRVIRGGEEIFDGAIAGLRRFKDDVREVATGYECGVSLEGFNDFQEGDVIQSHRQQRA